MTATDTESIDILANNITERLDRMEGEVAELRHTVSELATIVVGDIRDRREAALAVSAPVPETPIPASLLPEGELATGAVRMLRKPWLLLELLGELGAAVRMYVDPRYRLRRSTQLLVPGLLALLVANYFVFNWLFLHIPVVTEIIERAIIILLAFMLYKVLSREVARYRQMIVHLTVSPRGWSSVPASLLNPDPDLAALRRQDSP